MTLKALEKAFGSSFIKLSAIIRWPVDDTGKNSVSHSMIPRKITFIKSKIILTSNIFSKHIITFVVKKIKDSAFTRVFKNFIYLSIVSLQVQEFCKFLLKH